jgi:hypothetical protein
MKMSIKLATSINRYRSDKRLTLSSAKPLATVLSSIISVYIAKDFPGILPSTPLAEAVRFFFISIGFQSQQLIRILKLVLQGVKLPLQRLNRKRRTDVEVGEEEGVDG